MSDRARTDEIDDVLSSVRKLVSIGEKHAPQPRPKPDAPQGLDRFVLTQALRVTEPEPEIAEEPTMPEQADNILLLDAAKRADRAGLEATIAELEAAVTAQPDDWEPDEGEAFDEAAWAVSAFQLHEVAAAAEPATQETEEQPKIEAEPEQTVPPEVMADAMAQVDPAVLRQMVIETLREELAGEMGERITRNVRKLVRREINRVLVSRDLD